MLLALWAAPKEASGVSSAELVFGSSPSLPGELLGGKEKAVDVSVKLLQGQQMPPTRKMSYAEAACKPSLALQQASHVYVRRGGSLPPLAPPYVGPYRVIKRTDKWFLLDVGGKEEKVSTDRLKPHQGTSTVQPALLPRRGRPRRASEVQASAAPLLPRLGGGSVEAPIMEMRD